ncbi:hypothetical protein V1509DRAFT_313833 [Lipomyces kononenkoae]
MQGRSTDIWSFRIIRLLLAHATSVAHLSPMAPGCVSCVEPELYNPCTPYFDFSKKEYVVEPVDLRHTNTKRNVITNDCIKQI